jgi:putative transposase
MSDYLYLVAKSFDLSIHSFVMMPNHFHLLVSAPPGHLSPALNHFMRETSRAISGLTGRINQTYGSRNHKTVIESNHYFFNAYKYIYRNPVRAGLCQRVEDYRYSTLSGLLGLSQLVIPVAEDTILFPELFDESALTWLNKESDIDQEEEVRRALKKSTFALAKRNGQSSVLERILI